jgi:hypothetical protein
LFEVCFIGLKDRSKTKKLTRHCVAGNKYFADAMDVKNAINSAHAMNLTAKYCKFFPALLDLV